MACTVYKQQVSGRYTVTFFNKITKKIETVGTFHTLDDANNAMNIKDCEFYKENPIFLPHNVHVSESGSFVLSANATTIRKGQFRAFICSAKTYVGIVEARKRLIESIIGI